MRFMVATWLMASVSWLGIAQETPPATASTVPGTFRSFIAVDKRFPLENVRNRQDRMHCFICEAGLNPVVAVFTRADPTTVTPDSALGKLIQALGRPRIEAEMIGAPARDPGGFVAKYRAANAAAFVIFLALEKDYPEDTRGEAVKGLVRDQIVQSLRAAAEPLNAPLVPFGLAASESPSTEAWKLDPGQDTTVVVYNRMKLIKRWDFTADKPLDDQAIAEILETAENAVTGK